MDKISMPLREAGLVMPPAKTPMMEFTQDGVGTRTTGTFYRGETVNYYPGDGSLAREDVVYEYLVKGLVPAEPMIGPETVTVAFGSCFAAHLSNHLSNLGFNNSEQSNAQAYVSIMGDGIVNTYAIRQQFEWAWERKVPQVPLWHGYDGREFGYDEDIRGQTRRIFDAAEVFILTLGLSEVWYDEPTGEVFWRAVPMDRIDLSRHKFRNTTTSENIANLEAIYSLIRRRKPNTTIVFTLSPVGLTATFRNMPALAANAASKAILRAALDEFKARHGDDGNLFYFPSYEVVLGCFERPFSADRKHPHWSVIDFNLALFERYFCRTGMTDADLLATWRSAREEDRRLALMSSEEAEAAFAERREAKVEQRKQMRQRVRIAEQQARIAVRQEQREAERQAGIAARQEQREAERQARIAVRQEQREAERQAGIAARREQREAERQARIAARQQQREADRLAGGPTA